MKIISGFLKGKNIKTYDIDGTRPTMDRVKESVFGTIQDSIPGSMVLDLFAGSGNLGIEAISNGAKMCYFVDNNIEVIKRLRETIKEFKINDKANIILSDWKKELNNYGSMNMKFDIIFVDPPYDYLVYDKIINKVIELNLLNKNGYLILEHSNLKFNNEYNNLILYKEKKYGNKSVNIYKCN